MGNASECSSRNGRAVVSVPDSSLLTLTLAFPVYGEMGLMDCTWNCSGKLQEIEKFTGSGVKASVHGTSGRVPVRMSPENATASGAARKFING